MGQEGGPLQTSRYAPEQESILNQFMKRGAAASDFGPIEQQEKQRFSEETVPGLAERFTAMGGGQRSSAFEGALGQASAGLGTGLSALRSQYGMQQAQMGFQPRFDTDYMQRQPGLIEQGIGPALGIAGKAGQQYGENNVDAKGMVAGIMKLLALLA